MYWEKDKIKIITIAVVDMYAEYREVPNVEVKRKQELDNKWISYGS